MAENFQLASSLASSDIERLIRDRRDFHAHPELAYNEQRTATTVAERLEGLSYEVTRGVGRTGVVGLLEGLKQASEADSEADTRALLYRADMDALPVQEENDVDYRSQNDGVMHACGHDAHVA
ncbi:MAG TPA: M20/M25/M40 family metallo-hydrolase, partial [Blastocatellia bacterium]|nr:M20/M25/M40 family metallo-hydrolase [Blastocatellia bacterium]